jgi:hypothetical protein
MLETMVYRLDIDQIERIIINSEFVQRWMPGCAHEDGGAADASWLVFTF